MIVLFFIILIKNGANFKNPKLYADFVLRVNFVGIGRFAIAIGADIYMGHKKEKLRSERMYRQSEQILLGTTKVYYKQADMWISAKDASEAIDKMEEAAFVSVKYMQESLSEIGLTIESMALYKEDIECHNPGLLNEISNTLKYGK